MQSFINEYTENNQNLKSKLKQYENLNLFKQQLFFH